MLRTSSLSRVLARLSIAYLVIASWMVASASCEASIVLGEAGNFGIIAGSGVPKFKHNNGDISGNIGVANPTGTFEDSGPAELTGDLLFAGDEVDVELKLSNTTLVGDVLYGQSSVTSAMTTLRSLSDTSQVINGTDISLTGNSERTLNVTDGAFDIGTGNYYFDVDGFKIEGALTILGGADDYVVFNITTSDSEYKIQDEIILSGGITADHVLFNMVDGKKFKSSGNHTVSGIFLNLDGQIELNSITINGRLFGGGTSDMSIVSNFFLNAPESSDGDGDIVPEPASLLAWAGLLAAAGFGGLRRRQRRFPRA